MQSDCLNWQKCKRAAPRSGRPAGARLFHLKITNNPISNNQTNAMRRSAAFVSLFEISLFVISLILTTQVVPAQTPSTQPATTQPAVEVPASSPMRQSFDQLADADPKIRDKARLDLMGLASDELPMLRQLIIEKQPISPMQSAALREVVTQVYLAGKTYKAASGETVAAGSDVHYCLGIFWDIPPSESARLGLCVDQRLAGFPAYRYLRKGDIILGIYIDPKLPLETLPNRETHNLDTLREAIDLNPGAQNVELDVLRCGETIRVALKMAPRPTDADVMLPRGMSNFNALRLDDAEAYWEENFAPLMPSRIDPSEMSSAR